MTDSTYPKDVQEFAESMIEFDIYQNQTKAVEAFFADGTFQWNEVTNLYDADGTLQPIFEWWSVSQRLSEQLAFHGQPILSNDYGIWFGRYFTGQPIIMDGTLQDIVMSIETLND